MAELFVNPLVPLPVTFSSIRMTTNPVDGNVLTSDAEGNATWQPTDSTGSNVTVANGDPHILITNNSSPPNLNHAQLSLKANTTLASLDISQTGSGAGFITNNVTTGDVLINAGSVSGRIGLASGGNIFFAAPRVVANGADVVTSSEGVVTQLTSITTTVVLNGTSGTITTVTTTLAAGATAKFTLTNSNIVGGSIVFQSVTQYNGTTGIPYVYVDANAVGSCVIALSNVHPTDALNGSVLISFLIG